LTGFYSLTVSPNIFQNNSFRKFILILFFLKLISLFLEEGRGSRKRFLGRGSALPGFPLDKH
jgi:hypothetical protein